MRRLTTNDPHDNFSTMLNLVFPKDGWSYIRDGGDGKLIADFCLSLCQDRKCGYIDGEILAADNERKDQFLCDCAFEPCPIADVYAALCGFSFTQDRLMLYEEACFDAEGKELVTPEMILKLRSGQMREERHGRWLPPVVGKYGCLCSACNIQADNAYDYCPNCGAKMDLEVQHGESD